MNKNVIITGGTNGLGLEISKFFLGLKTYNVIILGRNKKNISKLPEQENVFFYKCDLSKYQDIINTFKSIRTKFKLIDTLINNASVFKNKMFTDMNFKEIDNIIDTNLKGYIFTTKFFLKIRNKNFCRIINISSVAGEYGIKNQSTYCASKHGVNGFFDALAQELINDNVLITTICPGGISTPLWNKSNPYPGKDFDNLLNAKDIVNQIDYLLKQNKNVNVKKIITFPTNEWH